MSIFLLGISHLPLTGLTNFILFVNQNLLPSTFPSPVSIGEIELNLFSSILFKPIPDFLSPFLNLLMVVGITLLKMFQKTPNDIAPGGKNRQTNQDK
jgi:hypothetical protein